MPGVIVVLNATIIDNDIRGFGACLCSLTVRSWSQMEVQYTMTNTYWPAEIRLSPDKSILTIIFENGDHFDLNAEYLRVESPSAEVQGHSPAEKKTIGGKRNIRILTLESVGNYAIRPKFDDGHDTGIFTWRYLYELGEQHATKWSDYLDRLQLSAQRREP